ncbi:MAG: cation:proton antiporter [Syntrophorhabdaceae bacterium]|nr:cation:proton antiporter [Syntrophorhabdaceae bacterium]MDD5245407.1 cation:proton antiporter [Syntrophorhabdaceae bacterium]
MELESFILSAVILLIAASVIIMLFRHLGLGSIAGLLVTGIIVGPNTPGPHITTHVEGVRSFTELGVVLLLFVIGLEIRPSRLWALRRQVFGLGSLQIIFTTAAVTGYALLNNWPWKASLIIGMTMAVSSTALVMQVLQEKGEIASPHGRTAFGILLMQDLAIIPMLAIIPVLAGPGTFSLSMPGWKQLGVMLGLFLLVWGFGKYVVPFALERLAYQKNREGFLMVAMLSVFLAAWALHRAGFSFALGAFLMGMLLSDSQYNMQIEAYIEPYKGILMSLFFVAVGMSIDLRSIIASPLVFIQNVGVVLFIKIGVTFVLCLLFGMGRSLAISISFFLAQGGEFGFVLLTSAKALEVIDNNTFVMGIGVISVGMLFTPLMAKLGDYIAGHLPRKEEGVLFLDKDSETKGRVIIGGYGRVGHVVAVLLNASRVPFIVFDNDPVQVAKGKKDGFPVYYGDIANPELLTTIHVEQATLVVLTVDQERTALQTISHVRNNYPGIPVIARARDLEASGRLVRAGATLALPEAVESSLRLATDTLRMVGVSVDNVDLLLSDVRKKDYKLIDPK